MVRTGPILPRRRRIVLGVIAAIVLVVVVLISLMGLRVQLLFLDSLGHTNVFWNPFWAQLSLFFVGLAITGGLVALSIPLWVIAAGSIDRRGGRIALWAGIALALVVGIAGGIYLAQQWQDVLLWQNGHSFGHTDPVFGKDYSFFLFTLPVIDHVIGLAWGAVVVSLVVTVALALLAVVVETSPEDLPLPLQPPAGRTARDTLRTAVMHGGVLLAAVFVLAALGAHFGAYHLSTSQHDNFVGLDATQRNVIRPVLGALQWVAVGFAVATLAVVLLRRRASPNGTGIVLGSLLVGWLALAGLSQGIPAAIYQNASVNPNAQTAQSPAMSDYLATSRDAWGLQVGRDVEKQQFGNPPGTAPTAPTPSDLSADPGTLANVRIQDFRELPDTFAQIDRSRGYQTFPTITVDRYKAPDGTEKEVMLGPREISESSIPNPTFVNRALNFTHGYGITAVSVSSVGNEGKPDVLAGAQPLTLESPVAPLDLQVKDPRIYCGADTTQPVVANTQQAEFDYPSGSSELTTHFGTTGGMAMPGGFDRLALSLNQFSGLDLFLTSQTTSNSRVLLHRQVVDRVQQLAPWLTIDADPYVVADPTSGHLVWIVDGYVTSDRFPESFQQDNGTSYMRNAVKATIDARTCATTLYAVDPSEPMTATYMSIFPGLLSPLDKMPMSLRAHLRYPEDLFHAQSLVYTAAHITDPAVLYNRSDLWRLAEEQINNQQQATQAYYVELTLPGDTQPQFVLLQTFSPAANTGGGTANNNMTAWLAARCDYTTGFKPKLVAVPINNGANVLGPLQFDNNINTDQKISPQLTLLRGGGSNVVLGNVIVLPFNNRSFLYVRPLYVQASNGSFPQLKYVIAGTQNAVALGSSFGDALATLFGQPIAGAPTTSGTSPPTSSPTPTPSPGASPTPGATPPAGLSAQAYGLLLDLYQHEQRAEAALQKGDFATYGTEEAAVKRDIDQLTALNVLPSPSPFPSPAPSPTH
ncbi:MAG TPA: UPF0182 family protein [Candidatus Angelobacter sp.]|nr:UPF0182 family protein [Candidatus Angelobacter sp.]